MVSCGPPFSLDKKIEIVIASFYEPKDIVLIKKMVFNNFWNVEAVKAIPEIFQNSLVVSCGPLFAKFVGGILWPPFAKFVGASLWCPLLQNSLVES